MTKESNDPERRVEASAPKSALRRLPLVGRAFGPWWRRGDDPAHAPGHRRLRRPRDAAKPPAVTTEPRTNEPYTRTTHSDSQTRRPRG